jgi:uncharacterized protein YdeI (YjbR/CyaY-like superfamily)
MLNKIPNTFYPTSISEWRQWLEKNGTTQKSVWIIYYKKHTGKPSIIYSDAVDVALCFGWIDSTARPIGDDTYMQYFCQRKPTSTWSRVNKLKIERLTAQGLMEAPGLAVIETAKQNGTWTILDDVENLVIPDVLETEFAKHKNAKNNFLQFSRTDQRNILQWLKLAKREETVVKRVIEIAELAEQGKKPKQFTVVKKN